MARPTTTLDEFMAQLRQRHPDWMADTEAHLLQITTAVLAGPPSVVAEFLDQIAAECERVEGKLH